MFGAAGSHRRLSRARRGSSPNVHPPIRTILQQPKYPKGTLLNPALLDDEYQYSEHGKFYF